MKIGKSLTGTCIPLKTLANRNRPLPLLVVPSGNISNGLPLLLALFCKLSRVIIDSSGRSSTVNGASPVHLINWKSEISLKPTMSTRGVSLLEGTEIAAEPVPVLRPGRTGEGITEEVGAFGIFDAIGRVKIGLNLQYSLFKVISISSKPFLYIF